MRVHHKKICVDQGRPEISKIAKMEIFMVWGSFRASFGSENRRGRCAAHNFFKKYVACRDGLAFRSFSRSNIVQGWAKSRPLNHRDYLYFSGRKFGFWDSKTNSFSISFIQKLSKGARNLFLKPICPCEFTEKSFGSLKVGSEFGNS